MRWFIPNWSGDYRLLSKNGSCVLEVVDPTGHEKLIVEKFLKAANKKGWLGEEFSLPVGYRESGKKKTLFELDVPIAEAGPVLVKLTKPIERTITAVKFADGKLEVIDQAKSKIIEAAVKKAEAQEEKTPDKKAAAASVSRPTTCCPDCVPGSVERASDALLSFLTEEQHEQWAQSRSIVVEGNLTGHRYVLAHRHSPRAIEQTKICYDMEDRFVVHFHKNDVPPEEEVLAAKLVLEHREHWLRNEATCFYAANDVFKNPFGDFFDGVRDSRTIVATGVGIKNGIVGGLAASLLDLEEL